MFRLPTKVKNFVKNENLSNILRLSSTNADNKKPSVERSAFNDGIKISTKIINKLPHREPLVKNFFLGKVDKEFLAFPEVIPRDDMTKLQDEIWSIKKYFENLNYNEIEKTGIISKEIKDELKHLGLFGLNIPQNHRGKGYLWSESLIASESETNSTDIASILISHRVVSDVLNSFGSDYQKEKYLSGLADGSFIAAEAVFENINSDETLKTFADFDVTDKSWTLKGDKSFIVSGAEANLFLVLAETNNINIAGDFEKGFTMFIVDSSSTGVKISKPMSTFGCQGAKYCSVSFSDVKLTEDNVIGNANEAHKVAQILLRGNRIRTSHLALGIMKNLINDTTRYCIETKHGGVPLANMETITSSLSKLICQAYAMESMIYFTTGLMDEFDNQDVDLEAAITKLYTMENLLSAFNTCLGFMGQKYLLPGEFGEVNFRNAIQLYTLGESIDSLRLFISLSGLQHTGMTIHETISKQRNPLFNPGFMISKFLQSTSIESPKTNMQLGQELHPSLEAGAQCLEHSLYRMQMSTDLLLSKYGNEIIEKHSEIKRLTEMVTLIYASFTSLARASRSYCIGLKLADHELLIASTIAADAKDHVKNLATEVFLGPVLTSDNNYKRMSKQILKSKGYFSEHPLTFNY